MRLPVQDIARLNNEYNGLTGVITIVLWDFGVVMSMARNLVCSYYKGGISEKGIRKWESTAKVRGQILQVAICYLKSESNQVKHQRCSNMVN